MDFHPGLQLPTMLRRCDGCGRAENPSRKLRKCASCEYVVYCSKECQRFAWPDHKYVTELYGRPSCRYMQQARRLDPAHDAEVRAFGFAGSLAFSRALNDWMNANFWAFQTSTQATILQLGGIDFLGVPPRYMMCFELTYRNTPGMAGVERNPALTFTSLRQCVMESERWLRNPINMQYWDSSARERELFNAYMQHHCGRMYAGLICVVFKCSGITPCNMIYFPILHTHKPLPLDQRSLDILDDVDMLCSGTINTGFPLRCPEGSSSKIPLPGQFKRRAGKWMWEPLFDDWDDYSPTSKDYKDLHALIRTKRKTDLTPKQLLTELLAI
ncbi:hypothetical protein C8Q77DRAFT_1216160 [Trametes polyzona]|nr:hypothetical protein C8Q77DRAFT_1216160 [Trametes polyzona]